MGGEGVETSRKKKEKVTEKRFCSIVRIEKQKYTTAGTELEEGVNFEEFIPLEKKIKQN